MKTFKISLLALVVLFGVRLSIAYAATPVITSISPTYTYNSDNFIGDEVNVNGTDFPSIPVVFLDGNVDTIGHGVYTSTTTSFNVKATTSPGVHTIEIGDWLNPSAPHSNKFNLTVKDNNMRPASISDIITSDGKPLYTDSAHELRVYSGYTDSYVLFDGVKMPTTYVVDPFVSGSSWGDYVKFTVPAGVTAGAHTVQLGGQNGLRELSNIKTLTFFAPSTVGGGTSGTGGTGGNSSTNVPVIISTTPTPVRMTAPSIVSVQIKGAVNGKTIFLVDGSDKIGIINYYKDISDSSSFWADFHIPFGTTVGTHYFQVDLNGDGNILSGKFPFEIFRTQQEADGPDDPFITFINPVSAKPGDVVTAYGGNIKSDTYIEIAGGVSRGGANPTITARTTNSISFIVPAQMSSPAKNKFGYFGFNILPLRKPATSYGATTYRDTGYTYLDATLNIVKEVTANTPQAPTISSISSSSVPQDGTVNITGTGFLSGSQIIFDDGLRSGLNDASIPVSISSQTAPSLTFKIPAITLNPYTGNPVYIYMSTGKHTIQVKNCSISSFLGTFCSYSNPIWINITAKGTTPNNVVGYPEITPSVPNVSTTSTTSTTSITPESSSTPNTSNTPNISTTPQYPTISPNLNPASYNFGNVTLFRGSRGDAVKELQRFFNEKFNLGLVEDGKFGKKTDAQVRQWQRDHGLTVDGRVGAKTKAKMNAE